MKTKYLDLPNCHALMPKSHGLSVLSRLDECLAGINNMRGELNGSIDYLVKQNISTVNSKTGAKRLTISPIEISQNANVQTKIVHTSAMTKPIPNPAFLHVYLGYENGMNHQTIIPLQYLLKGWGDASIGYQGYIHTISTNINSMRNMNDLLRRNLEDENNYYYVGITGRNWLMRLEEHIYEMRIGNRRRFYQYWKEMYGSEDVLFTSTLDQINLTYEEAMNWEELKVDKIASDRYGLNMIPGGFKGLKYLHSYKIINNLNISLEERERAISEYVRSNPRKGLPNPFIADLWKDDNFYIKVIEAKEKTLNSEQVRSIRELNQKGISISKITTDVKALNEIQVKNVINGKTYKRIK